MIALHVRNVDLEHRMLRVRGKGDKDRVIPLTTELFGLLDLASRGRNPDDPIVAVKEKAI